MDIALVQQFPSYGFPCPTFEQNIIRYDDSRPAVDLQQRLDVLREVQLLVDRIVKPETWVGFLSDSINPVS